MKGPSDRTKVVVRHLPPTISQSNFVEHVDPRFAGRYSWLAFRTGKSSQKHLIHSRAYINFNRPEDVIEFAEFFNGHIFVNEKGNVGGSLEGGPEGSQFKAIVEYAPSQRVPKQWPKKDGREGTILKDPEYLEFLDFLAKPVENLPSAEIQLERKEAERAGAPKDVPIVTPLMDYVRQKRAAKGRRAVSNGKSTRRVSGISSRSSVSGSSRRGSEKKKSSTKYVLRDNSKGGSKDKQTYLMVPKQVDQQLREKTANLVVAGADALEVESGGPGSSGMGKKKILLLRGKEKEISVPDGASPQPNVSSPAKNTPTPAASGQHQQRGTDGRFIKSILLNRDTSQNQAPAGSSSEPRIQTSNQDRDKKPPRPPSMHSSPKEKAGIPEDKVASDDLHTAHSEKPERRTRNKDRPDRGVWTPRRSDGSHSSNDSSSSASQTSQIMDHTEDVKNEIPVGRGGEHRHIRGGRGGHCSVDNGSYRHGGRRGSSYNTKDTDGSSAVEGKPSKRVVPSGYGSHEKQVWVQKSSSGS